MANLVLEARVPRTRIADLLAVLVQVNGNSRSESVKSIAHMMSRALFEGAKVCQQAREHSTAEVFLEEAEAVSQILEAY